MNLTKHTAKNCKSVWSRAMNRYKEHTEKKQPTKIGFLIDSTASREQTWEQAQTIQAKMFRAVSGWLLSHFSPKSASGPPHLRVIRSLHCGQKTW